jgi:hypothetical protein
MKMAKTSYRKIVWIACLIGFTAACELPGLAFFGTPTPTPAPGVDWQGTVDRFKALHSGLKLPDYLMKQPAAKKGGEFEINQYFTVLKRLSLAEGLALDYVYRFDGMGGGPVIYTRPAGTPAYTTYEEYAKAAPKQTVPPKATPIPANTEYLESIRTDGTPESYFQLAVLAQLGSQFYLFWHSGTFDTQIIASSAARDQLITQLDKGDFGKRITVDQAAQARKIDLRVVVREDGQNMTVSYVTFSKWGGFYRTTFTFHKDFPHRLVNRKNELLVEYQCGIVF